jgi:hypothetical protein
MYPLIWTGPFGRRIREIAFSCSSSSSKESVWLADAKVSNSSLVAVSLGWTEYASDFQGTPVIRTVTSARAAAIWRWSRVPPRACPSDHASATLMDSVMYVREASRSTA